MKAFGPQPITFWPLAGARMEINCLKCGWSNFGTDERQLAETLEGHERDMHMPQVHPVERFQLWAMTGGIYADGQKC